MLRNGKKFRPDIRYGGDVCSFVSEHQSSSSSSSQLTVGCERNPMLNAVVLTRLFELCDLADLLEYRLVSKRWYASSLVRIRNEIPVKLDSIEENGNSSGHELTWNTINTKLNPDSTPFRCFNLFSVDFSPSLPVKRQTRSKGPAGKDRNNFIANIHKNVELFWVNYGQFIRKLKLVDCIIYSEKGFDKVIFEYLPNLERLKLKSLVNKCTRKDRGRGDNLEVVPHSKLRSLSVSCWIDNPFPMSWQRLFLQFAKIQKLKLDVENLDVVAALVDALASLDEIPLNELNLELVSEDQIASVKRLFRLRKLNITKLKINVGDLEDPEEEHGILKIVMQKHGHKLKELQMESSCFLYADDESNLEYNGPIYNFPFRPETLDKLTTLNLTGFVFENYHFLEQTPNLKVLKVSPNYIEEQTDWERMKKTSLPFLSKFHVDSVSQRELKLRVLHVKWEGIDDEAITGIEDGCEERYPNITDLKELREIAIWNLDTGNVGDSGIRNGFLKLQYLRFLSVSLMPETSREAYDALVKQVPEGSIHTHPQSSVGMAAVCGELCRLQR